MFDSFFLPFILSGLLLEQRNAHRLSTPFVQLPKCNGSKLATASRPFLQSEQILALITVRRDRISGPATPRARKRRETLGDIWEPSLIQSNLSSFINITRLYITRLFLLFLVPWFNTCPLHAVYEENKG